MNRKTKKVLSDLIRSWKMMRERLLNYAARQGRNGDYTAAAENSLLSEGVHWCIDDLEKCLVGKLRP